MQGLFREKMELRELVRIVLEEVIEEEMRPHISAEPYERNSKRTGYRNGYKQRRLKTGIGEMELSIPQVRDSVEGPYQPSMPE